MRAGPVVYLVVTSPNMQQPLRIAVGYIPPFRRMVARWCTGTALVASDYKSDAVAGEMLSIYDPLRDRLALFRSRSLSFVRDFGDENRSTKSLKTQLALEA